MKRIKLANSKKYFTVSDEDYPRVVLYDWYLDQRFGYPFSSARIYTNFCGKRIYLARFILNETNPKQLIDHWDRNPLNNDRLNLRRCSNTENIRNQSKHRNCSSRFKGVTYNFRKKCWQAYIHVSGINIHLGYFDSEIEAAKAYDVAAKQHFKEFANLNFPESEHP